MPYYFGADYYTAMDRERYDSSGIYGVELPPSKIGTSAHPAKEQLEQLKANIFAGAQQVELGFMGTGKGSIGGGAMTPETYGSEQRQAIKELAKINKIELSTHVTPRVQGYAGFTERGFSDEAMEQSLIETKRTIDFAADTAQGGAVVVHTGEWQRPIFKAVEKYGGKFKAYPEEEKKGLIMLANEETGEVAGVSKEMKTWEPKVKEWATDPKTGKKIPLKYEYADDGTIKMEMKTFNDIIKEKQKENPNISEEEAYVKHLYDVNLMRAEAEALRFSVDLPGIEKKMEKIKKAKEYYEQLEKTIPEEEKWRIMRKNGEFGDLLPAEAELPSKILNELEKSHEQSLKWQKEYAISMKKEAEQMKDKVNKMKPIEEVGIKRTADTIARAALYAYKIEKEKDLEKPLFIAPENVFPEGTYGGHPQELKRIISESRESMAKKLVEEQKMPEEKAKEVARQHIKATFDIGHVTTWRKYFEGKSDEEFKKWVIDEVKDLVKSGTIGHIHISDNFGYYDEHLTPGEGIAPIKEFVNEIMKSEELRKAGIIVEPGGQFYEKGHQAMLGAWKTFGTSIYSALAPARGGDRWTDIEFSYFGKTKSPNYIVGEARPSEDWTLWSGVPLE